MTGLMLRRVAMGLVWVGLIVTSVLCAPEGDGQDGARVLAFFQLSGEPITVAIFNALGLLPMAFAGLLLRDPRGGVPIWPFVAGSFFLGAFALTPGLVLRRDARAPVSPPRWLAWITGPALGLFTGLAGLGLAIYAAGWGSPAAFWQDARSSVLVSTMSLDLVALCVLWPILVWDDAARHPGPAWRVALGMVPLAGPPLWLITRGLAGSAPAPGV